MYMWFHHFIMSRYDHKWIHEFDTFGNWDTDDLIPMLKNTEVVNIKRVGVLGIDYRVQLNWLRM